MRAVQPGGYFVVKYDIDEKRWSGDRAIVFLMGRDIATAAVWVHPDIFGPKLLEE
jgi:hypothetical protein